MNMKWFLVDDRTPILRQLSICFIAQTNKLLLFYCMHKSLLNWLLNCEGRRRVNESENIQMICFHCTEWIYSVPVELNNVLNRKKHCKWMKKLWKKVERNAKAYLANKWWIKLICFFMKTKKVHTVKWVDLFVYGFGRLWRKRAITIT